MIFIKLNPLINKGRKFFAMKGLHNSNQTNTTITDKIFENQIEPMLSIKELAKKLDCSISYIKKLKSQGKIYPEVSLKRFVRFKFSSVVASLKKWGINT